MFKPRGQKVPFSVAFSDGKGQQKHDWDLKDVPILVMVRLWKVVSGLWGYLCLQLAE